MRSILSFMTGLLSGAVVGVAAALLFAPASGDDLRANAQDRFERKLSDLRAAIEEERMRLEAELEALKRGDIRVS